jgi:hypothetical protein
MRAPLPTSATADVRKRGLAELVSYPHASPGDAMRIIAATLPSGSYRCTQLMAHRGRFGGRSFRHIAAILRSIPMGWRLTFCLYPYLVPHFGARQQRRHRVRR